MSNPRYPYRFDPRGRTAPATDQEHLRGLVEQVLFTMPGERVNRPDFGSGLMQLVFAPNNDALAAATQVSAQAALQTWLGHLIRVDSVTVAAEDSVLRVEVSYTLRRSRTAGVLTLEREVP